MVWEISPWKPFEFEKIRREMDRLWDSFLEGEARQESQGGGGMDSFSRFLRDKE